jgi:hypothetical protein
MRTGVRVFEISIYFPTVWLLAKAAPLLFSGIRVFLLALFDRGVNFDFVCLLQKV